ncbi:hypothetical protein EON80_07390 [bacterium]|nr:MAG: hypothetical protein EON80_07390 [bacterium]
MILPSSTDSVQQGQSGPSFPFFRFALYGALLVAAAVPHLALAQPDTTPKGIVPIQPKPSLTPEALQKLTGGPTRITFSGQNVPLKEIVALFRKVAGRETFQDIAGTEAGGAPISVNWKDVPYWTAAREVENLTGMFWASQFGGVLNLYPAGNGQGNGLSGQVLADTPYVKVVANTLTHTNTKSVQLGGKDPVALPQNDSANLGVVVYLDPRLHLEGNNIRIFDTRTSFSNAPLPEAQSSSSGGANQGNPMIAALNLRLNNGIKAGTRIATINGKLQANVVLATETFKVEDLLANPKRRQSAGTSDLVLENAVLEGRALKINVTAFQQIPPEEAFPTGRPALPGFYRKPLAMFTNLRVLDAKGREMVTAGSSLSGGNVEGGKRQMSGQFSFALQKRAGRDSITYEAPFSLEWTVPTSTGLVEIPFELRDILVP